MLQRARVNGRASDGTCGRPRVERYLRHVEMLFSPDLFIIGGGASKAADEWLPRISIDTPIVSAAMANNAGIAGAALVARHADL